MAFDPKAFLSEPSTPVAFDPKAFLADESIETPILPSVQAARNVAARQTPETGVLPETSLQDKLAAGIVSALNTVGNIPSAALNLAIKAAPYFQTEPGFRSQPSREDMEANDRLADIITAPIQDPYFKTVEALSGQPVTAPGSPIMENPGSAFLAELGAEALMGGAGAARVPSVGPTLASGVERAGQAAGSTLRAIAEPVATTRSMARGAMRATGTEPLFQKLNLSKTMEQKATNIFSPSPEEFETFISRDLSVLPEIKSASKAPIREYSQLQTAGKTAKSNTVERFKGALEKADESGLTSPGEQAYKNVEAALEGKGLTAEDKAQILTEFEPYNRTLKATEAQDILKTVNSDLGPLYRASFERQGDLLVNGRYAAKKAFRDSLSENVDEIIKATTGLDESPYRKYGMINDLMDKAQIAHSRAQISTAKRPAVGIPLKASVEGAAKAVGSIEGGVGRYNNFVRGLFEEIPNATPPASLAPETMADLIQKYTAQETLPNLIEKELEALKKSKFYREAGPATRKNLEEGFLRTRSQ